MRLFITLLSCEFRIKLRPLIDEVSSKLTRLIDINNNTVFAPFEYYQNVYNFRGFQTMVHDTFDQVSLLMLCVICALVALS